MLTKLSLLLSSVIISALGHPQLNFGGSASGGSSSKKDDKKEVDISVSCWRDLYWKSKTIYFVDRISVRDFTEVAAALATIIPRQSNVAALTSLTVARLVWPVEVRTTSWASVSLTRGSSTGPGLVTVGVEVRPRPRVREVRDNVVILMPDLHAQTGKIGTFHFTLFNVIIYLLGSGSSGSEFTASSGSNVWRQGCQETSGFGSNQCGQRQYSRPASGIQHGESSPGEFPWTCLILSSNNDFVGSCAIIPENSNNNINSGTAKVITAAHNLKSTK